VPAYERHLGWSNQIGRIKVDLRMWVARHHMSGQLNGLLILTGHPLLAYCNSENWRNVPIIYCSPTKSTPNIPTRSKNTAALSPLLAAFYRNGTVFFPTSMFPLSIAHRAYILDSVFGESCYARATWVID
jgi:hypothetical protein